MRAAKSASKHGMVSGADDFVGMLAGADRGTGSLSSSGLEKDLQTVT